MSDIEILEILRNHHINDTCFGEKLSVPITHAIDAIREKAERSKGCEWDGWTTTAYIGSDEDGEPKWALRKFYRCSGCRKGSAVRSKFCPNCGAQMSKEVTT